MKQRVEEYNTVCKETMDCVLKQLNNEYTFMNLNEDTLKLIQNTVKLVNTGTEIMRSEADMLNQIDKKLDDLNSKLLKNLKVKA